jgi:hypothetical protein
MDCVACGLAVVTERPECTAQGCRQFRCGDCGRQFNERSAGLLNRAQYPSDVISLVVLWRLRYRLTLRDLSEMFLQRGIVFLARIERRPARLDLTAYPYLPGTEVRMTRAADYAALLQEQAA